MNFLQIAGHLGADPEERVTPSGQKLTVLRLAANSRKSGKDLTVWWKITIWGDRFDKMMTYLKKGSALIAMGEMSKPEIYTNKEGNPQVSLELTASDIRFSPFGKGDRSGDQTARAQAPQNTMASSQGASVSGGANIPEDEIPF